MGDDSGDISSSTRGGPDPTPLRPLGQEREYSWVVDMRPPRHPCCPQPAPQEGHPAHR